MSIRSRLTAAREALLDRHVWAEDHRAAYHVAEYADEDGVGYTHDEEDDCFHPQVHQYRKPEGALPRRWARLRCSSIPMLHSHRPCTLAVPPIHRGINASLTLFDAC